MNFKENIMERFNLKKKTDKSKIPSELESTQHGKPVVGTRSFDHIWAIKHRIDPDPQGKSEDILTMNKNIMFLQSQN